MIKSELSKTFSERLQAYLVECFPGASISGFQFLTSGFESDVYTFDLRIPEEAPKSLILRLYPGEGAVHKMIREAQGLQRLRQDSYPVPAMLLYETQVSILGHPFSLVRKLEGKPLWPILVEISPARARQLLKRFGSLLARLHRLDWRPYTESYLSYEGHPATILEEMCTSMRALYLRYEVEGFLPILDWLESQRSTITVQPAVVHLDFHANNVFLLEDEPGAPRDRLAVIDWTQITVSDYRNDLCWTLMIMGDYGSPQWGEIILEAYQQAAGHPVEDLDYFKVIAYTKLLASTVISFKVNPMELGMRPETAKSVQNQAPTLRRLSWRIQDITGRRVPEVEALLAQMD